jgi:hypothetical protein
MTLSKIDLARPQVRLPFHCVARDERFGEALDGICLAPGDGLDANRPIALLFRGRVDPSGRLGERGLPPGRGRQRAPT